MDRIAADDGHDAGVADDAPSLSRAERRDLTAQRILDVARHCFTTSGFQGASMHQICAELGMSPGALYRYFPSKEAIIQAITDNDRREDAELFGAMFRNSDIVAGIVEAAMGHVRHVRARDLSPLFAEIRAESARNPAIAATCQVHRGEIAERFQAYLEGGIARGEIDPVVPITSLMAMFMALGEGLALNDLIGLGVPERDIEAQLTAMVGAMLRPTGRRGDARGQSEREA